MPTLDLSFKIDASPLLRVLDGLADALEAGTENPHIRNGLEGAQTEYLESMRERFVEQSGGAGEWPELARLTQRERARLGFNPTRPILTRLAILYTALRAGQPGSASEFTHDSLRAGIGGPERHPGYGDRPPSLTIGQIAEIHQRGLGRVPVRRILVDPSDSVLARMRDPLIVAVQSLVEFLTRHEGMMRQSAAA
jgi:hypothetical protein